MYIQVYLQTLIHVYTGIPLNTDTCIYRYTFKPYLQRQGGFYVQVFKMSTDLFWGGMFDTQHAQYSCPTSYV